MNAKTNGNGHRMSLAELDLLVLTADLPQHGLCAGDVGTVVHAYSDALAYEVEFTALDGSTVAVTTVEANQARAATRRDITHTRLAESQAA
jgi:hypothetical protein